MGKHFNVAVCLMLLVATLYADSALAAYSARTFGMGDTFTAISDDLSALFYNPAGLGQQRFIVSTGATYNTDARNAKADPNDPTKARGSQYKTIQAGAAVGGFGVAADRTESHVAYQIEGIPMLIQHVSNRVTLGYGRKVGNTSVRVGLAAGAIVADRGVLASIPPSDLNEPPERIFTGDHGTGYSLRTGILLDVNNVCTLGMSLGNLGALRWNALSDKHGVNTEELPPELRIGAAYRIPSLSTTLAADYDSDTVLHLGAETKILFLTVRYGRMLHEGRAVVTSGLGISLKPVQLDLAFQIADSADTLSLIQGEIQF